MLETWVEAGILGQGTVKQAMTRNICNKAMRLLKLIIQPLWQLLRQSLLYFIKESDAQFYNTVSNMRHIIIDFLAITEFVALFEDYIGKTSKENVFFLFGGNTCTSCCRCSPVLNVMEYGTCTCIHLGVTCRTF